MIELRQPTPNVMVKSRILHWSGLFALFAASCLFARGQDATDARIEFKLNGAKKEIALPILPAIQEFKVLGTTDLGKGFAESATGAIDGFTWTDAVTTSLGFYKLQITPLAPDVLAATTLLDRIAYGPTPDELQRVAAMGPQAYIAEQLAPESIQESLDIDNPPDESQWRRVVATGTATSGTLYIYQTINGDCYLDDVVLVRGTVPEVGANLVVNGGFEAALSGPWTVSTNMTNSVISTDIKHGGNASLHVITTDPGSTKESSIWQTFTVVTGQPYTLSYWYLPGTNRLSGLNVRLSGSGVASTADTLPARMGALLEGEGSVADLRAWHAMHAVRSKKQLLEVLLQFCENHFVTQVSKTRDYFDQFYDGSAIETRAARTEFNEIQRWRAALLKPQCTFLDLLTISAESPAMIIYLDTVNSKGNASNVANENYARELLELFTFGVDNGYEQKDITAMSRAWTGWSVNIVDKTNEFNPFALRSTNFNPNFASTAVSNLVGLWTFNYKQANHNTASKLIFTNKTVPARFGAPWAGKNYQLTLPARTGTNGIKDGYEVLAHLANQPFTQEFISVKLCRLLIHDDFATGYDFTDPNLSPEGKLVHECMMAWESGSPKGQIRRVLATIFNSELFRSNDASLHKVKTPFEFTVGTIRAMRALKTDGSYTADTDGYSLVTPMDRMGNMKLFDRGEPDGYPESAPGWISAGTLAERLRFVQSVLMAPGADGKADAGAQNLTDPVALLKLKLPSTQWNDAGAVADFFLGTLFPAEGKANLNLYRKSAMKFLNTGDDGVAASFFASLGNTTTNYDTRVRGVVAMLMTFQRFQEQ